MNNEFGNAIIATNYTTHFYFAEKLTVLKYTVSKMKYECFPASIFKTQ